jgi:hypothetical protein
MHHQLVVTNTQEYKGQAGCLMRYAMLPMHYPGKMLANVVSTTLGKTTQQ